MSDCGIEGCERSYYARGVCEMHYKRWRFTGTTDPGPKAHAPIADRFWKKVCKTANCWEWIGGLTGAGYGIIQEAGKGSKNLLAHRVSYTIHKGEIPDGLQVLHSCDNRACVNPDHLRPGTQSENIIEAYQRGRKLGRDRKNGSKLELHQVQFIKQHPELTDAELARMYIVTPGTIRAIRRGITWKET